MNMNRLIIAVALAAFTSCAQFPPEMTSFKPVQTAPVFSGTDGDTWDRQIRERGFILYEDGLYKMWYTGYNNALSDTKFLGYATSTDGVNWERYAGNPIFTDKWTEDMCVVRYEDTYYMYAEGVDDVAHLLTSPDGIAWQEQGDLSITTAAGEPVPPPFGTPSIWIEDGKWYLFYERNDSAVWIATSEDRLHWRNLQDEPVLKPGPEPYDKGAIAVNQIVKYKGKYFLYYHATPDEWGKPTANPAGWNSNVAMSSDLFHWTKYPGNPIVGFDYSSPIVVFDGATPSLYTMHPAVYRYTYDFNSK